MQFRRKCPPLGGGSIACGEHPRPATNDRSGIEPGGSIVILQMAGIGAKRKLIFEIGCFRFFAPQPPFMMPPGTGADGRKPAIHPAFRRSDMQWTKSLQWGSQMSRKQFVTFRVEAMADRDGACDRYPQVGRISPAERGVATAT